LRNLISCGQFTRESLDGLYRLTDDIKGNPAAYADKLKGKIVAVLFFEPSTRTRLSFESAVLRLGGGVIGTENGKADSSASKGETLLDTIRVVQGYCDAIVLRHSDDDSSEKAASVANVTIINGGAGKGEHPTQALLDLYTVRAGKGRLDNLKIAVLGDLHYGRTVHSLLKLISLYDGISVYGLSMPEFALPDEYVRMLSERGINYTVCGGFGDIPRDVDVLYHTRIQSERIEGSSGKECFVITQEVLNKYSDDTMLLHPLPRNNEICTETDSDPRSLFFEQTHNGIPVRMALLVKLMNG
jgi:aspartate carbamoyltransferase catalytic subunit